MVDFISLLLVFFVGSLPIHVSYGVLVMPYLTYLAFRKDGRSSVMLFLLGLILSLQNSEFFQIMFFLVLSFGIFYLFFIHLGYNLGNIVFIVAIQWILWYLFNEVHLNLYQITTSITGYFLVNYIYIKGVRR